MDNRRKLSSSELNTGLNQSDIFEYIASRFEEKGKRSLKSLKNKARVKVVYKRFRGFSNEKYLKLKIFYS